VKKAVNKVFKAFDRSFKRVSLPFCRKYVAVDITPGEIRVMSVRRNQVEQWKTVPLREGLIKDGIIIDTQDLSLVLQDLFTSQKLPRKRVICSITGLPFSYRTISMPNTGKAVTQEAIERAARKEMSITEPDMFIFWQKTGWNAQSKETDYFVAVVPKVAVLPLNATLAKARLKPYHLDLKPLALARLASVPVAMLLSLEKKYIDVVIVADGGLKTLYSFPPQNSAGVGMNLVQEAISGLDKALKSYDHDYPSSPLPADTPLLVCGELSSGEGILKTLTEASGHPAAYFESPAALPAGLSIALCAANLGLILKRSPLKKKLASTGTGKGSGYQDIDINLLGNFVTKGIKINVGQAVAVLSLILFLALLYFAYGVRRDAILKADQAVSENRQSSVQLLVLQKANATNQAVQTDATAVIQKLVDQRNALTGTQQFVKAAQYDCAQDIKTVLAALPENAFYLSIIVNKSDIQLNGQAASAYDALLIADRLEINNRFAEARVQSISPTENGVTFSMTIKKN
jgi:hypothetical protein